MLSLDPKTHTVYAVHSPVLERRSPESAKHEVATQFDPETFGVLQLRMSGIEYPLHARAFEEMRHKERGLFTKPWFVLLSNKEVVSSDCS